MTSATSSMSTPISQSEINKAVWNACDTFRGVISADTYKDFILTMLFLKYLSDVYRDEHDTLMAEYGDADLVKELMSNQRFVLPDGASFWDLYEQRHQPGNGQRIDEALHAIEEANGNKLKNVSPCVRIVVTPNNQVKGGNKEQRCPDTVKRENKLY